MDPFTQRMLERARARQEKINQKLADSGQTPKRKPLSENLIKSPVSPANSPSKPTRTSISSPRKSINEPVKSISSVKSPKRPSNDAKGAKTPNKRSSLQKSDQLVVASPQKSRNDVIVTRKEFKSPKSSLTRRNSDVSVEINISHRNDIQIEVQVEERDAPISVVYDSQAISGSNVIIQEIEDDKAIEDTASMEKVVEVSEHRSERGGLRNNTKSRLNRLGNLYSDNPHLSSPIHRTEQEFTSATPPSADTPRPAKVEPQGRRKFGRLAALADQINNWEDDLSHHQFHPEPSNKKVFAKPVSKQDESALDVSIHSIKDINKALQKTTTKQTSKPVNSRTFTKPSTNECQRLGKQIVAELEGEGYRRVSNTQSRLVYDFSTKRADPARQEAKCAATPSAAAAPDMTAMVAAKPALPVTKKPSIKKYKAPTPPTRSSSEDECESDKDKENNATEQNANECKQTKPEPGEEKPAPGSPAPKRFLPKLNVDRNSVLSKAAMFETGSPKAKDPAEMSLRERKALFEKNKGTAIIPKAPFGQAPSAKALHGDNKADKQAAKPLIQPKPHLKQTTPTHSRTNSKEEVHKSKEELQRSVTNSKEELARSRTASKEEIEEDTISQSSLGGGIKGKLAALFSKEQTISESTIANKFKMEREKEMEMLNNRFQYKPQDKPADTHNDSDDESDSEPSDKAPLMKSTISLNNANKKPEIVANVPKVTFDKTKSETALNGDERDDKVIGSQPVKRRSSQDSPVVLAVVDDVKRLKVNNKAAQNGLEKPRLYPHLSDIETDHTNSQEEFSECGGSSDDEDIPMSSNDKLNKSDNWAETSFGREVMNVVKKNNSSYRKAVRESDTDSSACDSQLDELLDEALAGDCEGATPPKLNKNGLSSTSFVYQEKTFKSPEKYKSPEKFKSPEQFKSPLKAQAVTPVGHKDKGSELVHSVSFYRRMQNASTPSTPLRVVRHCSPERAAGEDPLAPPAAVTTVRQRIKELQQEITKQQTVISQASQALNLCAATIEFSGSTEQAEGERLLLLATHRRSASVQEMQRLQVEGAGCAAACGMASLHITSLSVPLRRDYIRHLNADGAVGHHAVCLVKCRDRVLASSMQLTQPAHNILHFPDEIHMEGLTSDFKVTVEVYLLQASKEVLPHDVKYHIFSKKNSSKLLTPKGKSSTLKTPAVQSPAGPHAVRTPQFQLHGYCIFALPQATRKNFTLNKVPAGSPLEGSVNIDIRARLRVPPPGPHAAFLTAFDDVSGLGAWHRRWFRLQAPRLAYWKYPDDVHKKMPIGDIDLSTVISDKVTRAPRDLCARPNTILLETSVPAGLIVPDGGSLVYVKRGDNVVRRHLLAADTPGDRDVWLDTLNGALEYVRCSGGEDE